MSVKVLRIKPIRTDEETAALAGHHLQESDCVELITYDADVYCAESNKCLAKFRKGVVSQDVQNDAYENLLKAAKETDNRSNSSGDAFQSPTSFLVSRNLSNSIKADGTISVQQRAAPVISGIIGYFDRTSRFPYCRQTAFNQKHFDKFKKAYPIIKTVDELYSKLMPDEYALQRSEADNTSQDFVIKNTAFTTVTVNKNWQTAVHTDKGDFEKGFGNLVAFRAGEFEGGYFVLPKWGVGFDLTNGDVLLTDVHQWHGNTPIKMIDKNAVRLSLVMYYRKNMIYCGTAEEESEIAKRKKKGTKING